MRTVLPTYAPGVVAAPGRNLSVLVDRLIRPIPLSLIVRIEACGSHCQVLTRDGRLYPIAGTLAIIARSAPGFWQTHRSHLINPAYVLGSVGSVRHQGRLRLLTGEYVPVSRRRKETICQRLKQLRS